MISVRRTTYRGKAGWLICGHHPDRPNGWGVSIFTETEASARIIADKVKRGEEVALADYDVR